MLGLKRARGREGRKEGATRNRQGHHGTVALLDMASTFTNLVTNTVWR